MITRLCPSARNVAIPRIDVGFPQNLLCRVTGINIVPIKSTWSWNLAVDRIRDVIFWFTFLFQYLFSTFRCCVEWKSLLLRRPKDVCLLGFLAVKIHIVYFVYLHYRDIQLCITDNKLHISPFWFKVTLHKRVDLQSWDPTRTKVLPWKDKKLLPWKDKKVHTVVMVYGQSLLDCHWKSFFITLFI